jgi:hypothetical protein
MEFYRHGLSRRDSRRPEAKLKEPAVGGGKLNARQPRSDARMRRSPVAVGHRLFRLRPSGAESGQRRIKVREQELVRRELLLASANHGRN